MKDKEIPLEKSRPEWEHPGNKLIELGPASMKDEELIAILIGSGYKGRSAQDFAKELLGKFGSISGYMGQELWKMATIEGLGDVRVIRIDAAIGVVCRIGRALERQ